MPSGFLPDMTPPGTAPIAPAKPIGSKGASRPLASPAGRTPKKRGLATSAKALKGRR